MKTSGAAWWRDAVVYQIYPRSFLDTDGDGIGDLEGIRRNLEYLAWLGVDAIWLSPIFPSPMADFGYDVSNYCDVDLVFGDLASFDRLLDEAHQRGIRVMLDWVANHTSDRHPWFEESRSSPESPRRDWYIWRDGKAGKPPNNWKSAFGGPAWTYDEATEQWYLHIFLPEQPDLNWQNPDVAAAMHETLRFWMDRGVDGFRADVVHLIGKDPELPDRPEHLAHRHPVSDHDDPRTHPLLRSIRTVLDSYDGDRAMVGEVNLRSAVSLRPYYGQADELHMVFNFSLLFAKWDPSRWRELIADAEAAFAAPHAWPVWVLSNHDRPRQRTRYGGSEDRARVAALVLLTLRGTPFLYAGEELGLEDAAVAESELRDPGLRDGCRAPIPWSGAPGHGWPAEPWLPWPPDADSRNIAALRDDEGSILHLYRRLLGARRRSIALRNGTWELLEGPPEVLAYERSEHGERRRVVANFGEAPVAFGSRSEWVVEVGTRAALDEMTWDGALRPGEAVLLRPVDE
ncbi:MAG TPA: alpha-amylase family glycosyl hydrolase [Acidimicrobiales bacterium]|nr:alpha-amylase family glycosyl hydrolase [Acidimicrobiales bacterium]